MCSYLSIILPALSLLLACQTPPPQPAPTEEKAAILTTLNNETKAAFLRDYEAWKTHWVHADYVTKVYLDYPDSSFSESRGWAPIDDFVRTYIDEHPAPDPLPEPLTDIDVRLYGDGAWVSYDQLDPVRGRKRETRFLEKENGQWKIAGMWTTIYGDEAR